jgi:hypothetical protein
MESFVLDIISLTDEFASILGVFMSSSLPSFRHLPGKSRCIRLIIPRSHRKPVRGAGLRLLLVLRGHGQVGCPHHPRGGAGSSRRKIWDIQGVVFQRLFCFGEKNWMTSPKHPKTIGKPAIPVFIESSNLQISRSLGATPQRHPSALGSWLEATARGGATKFGRQNHSC